MYIDSNELNKEFYYELLYIMGLTEVKDGGRKIIVRRKEKERRAASLLENAIFQLSNYNIKDETQLFETALELVIIWINRILFLKLLEAQQLSYQNNDSEYAFLNMDTIKNFRDLNALFFNVLAVEEELRADKLKERYKHIPYLNSSLFDMTILENQYFPIAMLQDEEIEIYTGTVLKDRQGKKQSGKLNILIYIFDFLSAYDFSSEGGGAIQEETKTLINASVLGLIFEKINGYKDGSYFTPGFITTYICRQTIREAVLQKFNTAKNWNVQSMTELYNKIEDAGEANSIINDMKICDPAVGSGHFLVSALNEIIALKSELGILRDKSGKRLKGYTAEVANDELLIFDEDHAFYTYNYKNAESRRVQETIFNEKRLIIENCLFGVDINPNSVKICRLRLWIELLKNAYYTAESKFTKLETFPNLDFKILRGNSLLSIDRSDLFEDAELTHLDGLTKVFFRTTDIQQKRKLRAEINKILDAYSSDGRFDFKVWFSDVFRGNGGFDAVIGNPPYISGRKGGISEEDKKFFNDNYETAEYQLDTYIFFMEKAVKLLKKNGVFSYIVPNTWLSNINYTKIRLFLLKNISIKELAIMRDDVFAKAVVDTVIIAGICRIVKNNKIIINSLVKNESTKLRVIEQNSFLSNDKYIFDIALDAKVKSIISKIKEKSVKLSSLCDINRGVHAYRTDGYGKSKFQEGFQTERDYIEKSYHSEKKLDKTYHKEVRGKNIFPYYISPSKKYISWGDHLAEKREWRYFTGERIFVRKIVNSTLYAAYTNKTLVADQSVYIAKIKSSYKKQINIKFLLGFLNSRLLAWYFKTSANEYDKLFPQIKVTEFKELPIPNVSDNLLPFTDKIAALVDKILAAKAANADADTSALEDEIDALVYKLYGLTEDEIKIAEGLK